MEDKLKELTLMQCLLIAIGGAAFYYFFIFTTNDPELVISNYRQEISEYEGEIRKFDKKIEASVKLKEQIEVYEKELKVKFSYVSEDVNNTEILQLLSVEARNSGLDIETISESSEWKKLSSLEFIEIPVSVSGDFGQVMGFLSNLSREKKLIVTDKLELEANTDSDDSFIGKPRVVKLNVTVRVYRQIPGSTEFNPNTVVTDEGENV